MDGRAARVEEVQSPAGNAQLVQGVQVRRRARGFGVLDAGRAHDVLRGVGEGTVDRARDLARDRQEDAAAEAGQDHGEHRHVPGREPDT